MKTILLAIMLLTGNVNSGIQSTRIHSGDTYVYICTGPQSKKYHSSPRCNGLNRCSATIEKITLSKAKKLGRGPCGICYR